MREGGVKAERRCVVIVVMPGTTAAQQRGRKSQRQLQEVRCNPELAGRRSSDPTRFPRQGQGRNSASAAQTTPDSLVGFLDVPGEIDPVVPGGGWGVG